MLSIIHYPVDNAIGFPITYQLSLSTKSYRGLLMWKWLESLATAINKSLQMYDCTLYISHYYCDFLKINVICDLSHKNVP